MTFKISLLGVALTIALTGCGVKFADQTVNTALPEDFQHRTRISNSADFRFDLSTNVGSIIEPDAAKPGQYRFAASPLIRPPGFAPVERQLSKEDNTVYEGKITQGGAVSGNYATIGVSLSVNQAATFSIIDIAFSEIPADRLPVDALRAYAQAKKAAGRTQKEYWVKSFLLSRILKQFYTEENSNASGSGPAFGAEGKVYHTTSATAHDFNLAAVLVDIDTYASGAPLAAPPSLPQSAPGSGVASSAARTERPVPGVVQLPSLAIDSTVRR